MMRRRSSDDPAVGAGKKLCLRSSGAGSNNCWRRKSFGLTAAATRRCVVRTILRSRLNAAILCRRHGASDVSGANTLVFNAEAVSIGTNTS